MTGPLDLRPPQRQIVAMTGVPTDITVSLLDETGEPLEASSVDVYIGGHTSDAWPLPDPLGDVVQITGVLNEVGTWTVSLPGLPDDEGAILLRWVIDGALVLRSIATVGSGGSVTPTTEITMRATPGLVMHITTATSGGGGGGTVDSVARAAITSHTEETTAAHGGIVASTDPRLSDARTPTAHTHTAAEVTDLGSAATADVGDFAQATHSHTAAQISDLGNSATRNVGNTAGTVAAGDDPRFSSGGGSSMPSLPSIVPVGTYASQPGPYTTGSATLTAEGRATWSALWVPAGTWDAIGIWVTTTTAAVLRLCLDTMSDTTGLPTALVSDAGTVDCSTATGLRLVTFAAPVVQATPGWMWGRVVLTNATAPTLAALNAAGGCMWPPGIGDGGDFTNRAVSGLGGVTQATGAGEQPAPAVYFLAGAVQPRVWLRRSA